MTPAETVEVARIKGALCTLLAAMIEDEAQWPEPPLYRIRATPYDPSKPVRTRAEMQIDQLLQEPVYFACRLAIRRLGERLHAVAGGTDGMRQMAEEIAAGHPDKGSRFLSMLNSAWDEVGTDADRWWM